MIRITALLWVALLVVAGVTVMHVSYQVREIQRHLAEVADASRKEEATIRLLNVEWHVLSDPGWVDGLATRHDLKLGSTPIQRIVTLEAIPLKPAETPQPDHAATDHHATLAAAKAPKAHGAAKAPTPPPIQAPRNPELRMARAPAAPLQNSAAPDGVALLLARMERKE
jgi:hypothetical protein